MKNEARMLKQHKWNEIPQKEKIGVQCENEKMKDINAKK